MQSYPLAMEGRVRRLEHFVRVLSAAVVVLAGLLLIAARPASQTDLLRAQRIQLVDDDGLVRIDLRHDSTETGIFVQDGAGDTRIGVAQFAHGGGGFALHGPEMKGAAVLYLKGEGSLAIYDTAGTRTARFPAQRP